MVSRYDASVDLSNKNNSHTLIVELVGHGRRVLDVGASTGFLARVLTERGCAVTGIEIDPNSARQAEESCERVIVGNVEELDLGAELGEDTFDVLVFGDVLEHLKDPRAALERFKPFLNPGGHAVASIPNIAHGSVRLALLQGEFRYRPLGLLDNTHLRFFTRESGEEMFEGAGFLITDLRRTTQGLFTTEIEVDGGMVPDDVVRLLQEDPEAMTYQFVLAARPYAGAGAAAMAEHGRPTGELIGLLHELGSPEAGDNGFVYELIRKLRDLEDLRHLLDVRTKQLARSEQRAADLTEEVVELKDRLAKLTQARRAGS
jgi:2-polyprenyl-3-methyl-5-hydroxy-6-metoxy-1,4-benzoquinol methylase